MNSSLLHHFLPDDIEWLLTHGEQQILEPETVLSNLDNLAARTRNHPKVHIVLEGSLSLACLYQQPIVQTSEKNTAPPQSKDLFMLKSGELWGTIPFVSQFLPPGQLKILSSTLILSLDTSHLEQKLLKDQVFATRFYRWLTQLLSKRLADLNSRCPYNLALLKQLQLKEASTLFAALEDSDLDWLIAVGQVQEYQAGDRVTRLCQPLEALHIILEGSLSLMAPQQEIPPVYAAFLPPKQLPHEIEFARLSRGELLGDSFLVDPLPPAYSAQALRPTQLLSIPRWRLETKLLYDSRFAAQLYRVLTIVLANKQYNQMNSFGFQLPMQELDEQLLHQVNLAESRFDWLLRRLQACSNTPTAMAAIA